MASVTNNDHVNIYATISDSVDDPLSRSRPPDVEAPTLAPTQEKQSKYAHGFMKGCKKKLGFASLVLLIVIPVAYVVVAFRTGQSNEIVPGFSYNASRSYSALLWKTMKESLHIRVRPHGTPPHQDIVLTTTVRPLRGTAIDLPYASKKLEHLDSQNTSLIMNMTAMPGVQTEEPDTTPPAGGSHSTAMVHGAVTVAHYRQLPSLATSAPPPSGTRSTGVDTDPRAFSKNTPMGDPKTPRSKLPAVLTMIATAGTSEQQSPDSPKTTPLPKSPNIITTMSAVSVSTTEHQARTKVPKDNPALPTTSGHYLKDLVQGAVIFTPYRRLPSASAPPPPETEPTGVDTDPRAFSAKTPPMRDPQTPRSKPPAVLSMMSTPGTSEQQPLESPETTPPPKSPTITTTTMPDTHTEDLARTQVPGNSPTLLTTTGHYPKYVVKESDTYKGQITTEEAAPLSETGGGTREHPTTTSTTHEKTALSTRPPMISDEPDIDLKQPNTAAIPRHLKKANEKERKCSQYKCFGGQTVAPTQMLTDKTDQPYFSKILSQANLPTPRPKTTVFLPTPLSNGSINQRNSVDSTAASLSLKRPTITRKIPGMHAKDTTSDPSGIFKTIWTTGHYPPYKTKAHNQQMQTDTTPTPSKIGEAVPYHHPPDASTKLPEVILPNRHRMHGNQAATEEAEGTLYVGLEACTAATPPSRHPMQVNQATGKTSAAPPTERR
ncbi:mucin-6-like [Branchiostoma floridae]|uniref:Mucin-6-like n=1 Tax=Branchiostoma floridae TaxID=7739 RepID=A0A9J7N6F2_BRAFL|nr:mucin-6-like [Branchiostoma floridae]